MIMMDVLMHPEDDSDEALVVAHIEEAMELVDGESHLWSLLEEAHAEAKRQ